MRPGPLAPIVIDDAQTIAWLHGVMEVIGDDGHRYGTGSAGRDAQGFASRIYEEIERAMPWTSDLTPPDWRKLEGQSA